MTPTTITTSGGLLLGRDSVKRKASLSLLGTLAQRWAETRHLAVRGGAGPDEFGNAYFQLEDTRQAVEYWQQAIAIQEEIGDVMNAVKVGFNLAVLLAQQGRTDEALPYAERAAQFFTQIGHAQYAQRAQQLIAQLRAAKQ